MKDDFSKIKEFWGERLRKLPTGYVDHLGLNSDNSEFLTTVGLPTDLDELKHTIEINFYFETEKIIKKEFKGVYYVIIGDDSGTNFGVSLNDNNVYAVDFTDSLNIDPVCFVNSGVGKFVESIKCFIDFKIESDTSTQPETQLIELMKAQLTNIDKMAIDNERTWWRQIIDDPIMD